MSLVTEKMLDAIDETTAVVAFPHVLFRTSYIMDTAAIVSRAHRVGATVILDACQSALAGLDIIQEVGVARIRERSKELTAHLLDLVDQQGFTSAASRDPERLAGTVAVSVPDAQLVSRTLKARDFLVD